METCIWLCYIVISIILIPCSLSKSFSLNEAIAAESQRKQNLETTSRPKVNETTSELFLFNKAINLTPVKQKKIKKTKLFIFKGKKISPLKYRKQFQIRSPLKPKKLKHTHKPRYKRKNQSVKRETNGSHKINQKYIPLLKSLRIFFDNFLTSESIDSYEINRSKYRRNRYYSEETNDDTCECTVPSELEITEPKPIKTAITSTTNFTPAVTFITEDFSEVETTTTSTYYSSSSDISSFGQYPYISILPTRNTIGDGRDNYGFSERSGTTFYRSIERNITGNRGNNEHNTGYEGNETSTRNDKKVPYSATRNNSSGDRPRIQGNRNIAAYTDSAIAIDESNEFTQDKDAARSTGGNIDESEREDKLEIGGDKTKNPIFVPKFIQRLRGVKPKNKIGNITEVKAFNEESIINVSYNNASDKRITNGSGTTSTENKKLYPTNETMTAYKTSEVSNSVLKSTPKNKTVVMIIDGYSIARDKNGENKLAEKAIRIKS